MSRGGRETDEMRAARAQAQSDIIHSLLGLSVLPEPEFHSEEIPNLGEVLRLWLYRAAESGKRQIVAASRAILNELFVLLLPVSPLRISGTGAVFAHGAEEMVHNDRIGDWKIEITWTAKQVRVTWWTDVGRPPPRVLLVLDVGVAQPTPLAIIALPGTSSDEVSFVFDELGFDGTKVRWSVSLSSELLRR